MNDLSLFDVERALHELMDVWQEAETPEAIAAAELAIRAYAEAEVRKVDGIRRYIRVCTDQAAAAKAEAQVQIGRQRTWEARRDRLMQFTLDVMNSFGVKKLPGATGSLMVKGNGGLAPLSIVSQDLLPGEFLDVTITMPLNLWENFSDRVQRNLNNQPAAKAMFALMHVGTAVPSNGRIRAALEAECPMCEGKKAVVCEHRNAVLQCPDCGPEGMTDCYQCGGGGKRGVPGARLGERGVHLEVK